MAEETGKASRIEKFDGTDFGFLVGMATGWVRAGFLYARTRPAGLNPLPELAPINKRVFFPNPKPALWAPQAPTVMPQPKSQHKHKHRYKKTQVSDLRISLSKSQTQTQILTQIQT